MNKNKVEFKQFSIPFKSIYPPLYVGAIVGIQPLFTYIDSLDHEDVFQKKSKYRSIDDDWQVSACED